MNFYMYLYIFVIKVLIYYDILFLYLNSKCLFGNFNDIKAFLYLCDIL